MKGGPKGGGGWNLKRCFSGGGGRDWFNCNQWRAMLNFESMFDIGAQVLKFYFYVSVSYDGSVFSLATFGRLVVSDEYVELFDGLYSFCVLRGC